MLVSIGDGWNDLFVMTGGAAAALAGLLFVAVSLNHEEILKANALPTLAAQAVSSLIGLVVLSVCVLLPDQSVSTLGIELLVLGVLLAVIALVPTLRGLREVERFWWQAQRLAVTTVAVIPLLVATVLLLLGNEAGMYWAALEVVVAIAAATFNAWILLIEIRR